MVSTQYLNPGCTMENQTALGSYTSLKKQKDFVFVVFLRGHWCPFCMSYLTELETIRSSIEERNGGLLVVTAEDDSELDPVRKLYTGTIISDPKHELADYLHGLNLIHIAKTSKSGYPHGVAQPGILVIQGERKLYSWAIVPSVMNLGGAKDRPSLVQVKENIFAQLDGKKKPHKVIKTMTFWQGLRHQLFG